MLCASARTGAGAWSQSAATAKARTAIPAQIFVRMSEASSANLTSGRSLGSFENPPRKLRKFRRLVRHVRSPSVILLAADIYVPLIAFRISAGGPKRPVSAVLENLQSWFLGAVRRTTLAQAPGPQLRTGLHHAGNPRRRQ